MTPLRIAIAVLVAVLVLFVGGCLLFGTGTSSSIGGPPTTPTETTP
jgi:hypothetical protein